MGSLAVWIAEVRAKALELSKKEMFLTVGMLRQAGIEAPPSKKRGGKREREIQQFWRLAMEGDYEIPGPFRQAGMSHGRQIWALRGKEGSNPDAPANPGAKEGVGLDGS
jgi:hypothetical protein